MVDTGVFGSGLVPSSGDLARHYQPHLVGRRVIVAYQTVAELRYGALRRNWGAATIADMEARVRAATVAPVDDRTAEVYAELKDACVRVGHGLGQKVHDGDRWIAATAIRYRIPLVAHDGIFRDAPGLDLVTELEQA
ncbi:MAG TPA: PIN domain-containing protein [Acidimicrobiales bacterium]|nr:PIN domain-containing protein [Acidimicrobiales bacterium]